MSELTAEEKAKAVEMTAAFGASFMAELSKSPELLINEFGELKYDEVVVGNRGLSLFVRVNRKSWSVPFC